jgi:hypothetical protein
VTGAGNRRGDACGDNAQRCGRIAEKSERWVTKRAATLGRLKRAAKPSQGCFFGYNRVNSSTVSRPVGASTNLADISQKP